MTRMRRFVCWAGATEDGDGAAMSDETKGATVIPGCRHDNVDHAWAFTNQACPDCAVLINMETWRKLHPPPEPPKSWVDSKSDGDPGKKGLMRETVEECCRVLKVDGRHGGAEFLRRAMLEPKP